MIAGDAKHRAGKKIHEAVLGLREEILELQAAEEIETTAGVAESIKEKQAELAKLEKRTVYEEFLAFEESEVARLADEMAAAEAAERAEAIAEPEAEEKAPLSIAEASAIPDDEMRQAALTALSNLKRQRMNAVIQRTVNPTHDVAVPPHKAPPQMLSQDGKVITLQPGQYPSCARCVHEDEIRKLSVAINALEKADLKKQIDILAATLTKKD